MFTKALAAAVVTTGLLCAQDTFDGPPQAARGQELFFKTAQPTPCGNCHALGGKGTAVGPDLKTWARIAPRAAATAITATVTDKVVSVKPKIGDAFPGLQAPGADGEAVKFFDLSVDPPALKEFTRADVTTSANSTWKHPPGTQKYTAEQLADIIGYIRWAGARERKEIKPEDVQ